MRSESLKEIKYGLGELEKYIVYNSACNKLIADGESLENFNPKSLHDLIQSSKTFRRKKIFEYNSYIITLYGLFERFIENVLAEYLASLCSVLKSFDKLPISLLKNHIGLNVDVLKNIANPKFQNLSLNNFIHNIDRALNENIAVLNIEAFQHHPYNFKQSIISEYFGKVGFGDLSGILKLYDPLKSILNQKFGNVANLSSDVVFNTIDDLSQRRNDVAHGVENVELLNVSIIREYIIFIGAYCESLQSILENEYHKFKFEDMADNLNLIQVINHSIVCASVENISIKKGDFLLIRKPETNFPRYTISKIEEIQIDGDSFDKLTVTEKKDVGMRVNDHVKNNYEFKIITPLNNV